MKKLLAILLLAAPLLAQNPTTANWPTSVPNETDLGVAADRAYSALTVAMTATTGTITVSNGAVFPDEPFWVLVGPSTECAPGRPRTNCETVFITGVSGNVLTIGATGRQVLASCAGTATGGANPTHAAGEVVAQSISSCQYNQLTKEVMAIAAGMFVTHATDCTALTGTTTGQRCHEIDADTNYIWDGAAWDLIGSGGAPGADSVGTSELDDDANTPVAGSFVVVETGAVSFDYVAANAGTDVTADLEEETHATEHAENAADEILVENLGTACAENQIPKANATGGVVCATDETGGGGMADPGANGVVVRTALNTTVARTITGDAEITVTNGDGVAGAPTLAIAASIARDSELHAENHATRHSDGGADEVTVENLASACTDAQVLGGDGLGGLECQTDATGGSAINVEENNVEVISSANLTGIDFLGVDFDVTDDTNEANVAIAAAIARDSEVTSAVNAAVSGTAGRLPTFSGTNAVGNTNILAGADTLTFPVTTGLLIFGDGDTYIYETTDDALRIRTGGTDRLGIDTGTLSSLVAGGGTMRFTGAGSAASAIFTFATDVDNGLYYIGTNNWAATAGGTKIIDYQAAQVGFLTTTGLFSAAAPTTDAAGEAGFDNDAHAASRGAVQVFDGTANTYLIGALASDTPTNGQVPKWNTGGTITWEDDGGSGSGDAVTVNGVAVDTTADLDDTATVSWTLVDGGAGGPDQARAAVVAESIPVANLSDVDDTGRADGDGLCWVNASSEWHPCEVATPDNVIALTNKTIDGGAPRTTTTTLPTGANEMPMCRHEDDVTSLTGVADGVPCFEEDSNIVYVCESPEGIAGVCDAPGEWTAQSAAASETNNLETQGAAGIATTEIPIGTGAGTVAYAALSGDATMTSGGVVEVTQADALEANGSNCSGTQYAQGVTAAGVSEGCTAIPGSKSFLLPDPATADTGKLQFEVPSAVTLTEISCNVDAATSVTINLVERARATPDSGTTEMITTDLVCDTDGATTTTFTDAALAGDVPLTLMIDAVAGSPTWLRVHVQYTVN